MTDPPLVLPPLVAPAVARGEATALVANGREVSFRQLLDRSARGAGRLLRGSADLTEARVAFLVPPDDSWVATLWSILLAGGTAVPLGFSHPEDELAYAVDDADATFLVVHPEGRERLAPVARTRGIPLLTTPDLDLGPEAALPPVDPSRRAMLLYTSGTTSRPKGAVHTHASLAAQVETLLHAWRITGEDRTLLVLPLHHVHGIVNVVSCALSAGAACEMLPGFDAEAVWSRIERGAITLFMAVPTVYAKLLAAFEAQPPERRRRLAEAAGRLRLMVSGSSALPPALFSRWREITGHDLLERYGMTEIGMALSNPLDAPRVAGSVGTPLPGVEVRLVDETGLPVPDGAPGELLVRGPGVFREYWRRTGATSQAFRDGWFVTGDVAVVTDGAYRILGRKSVDILKSGGYKVSALEVEAALREHPAVRDVAVVGVADPEWGERIAAAVVAEKPVTLEEIRSFARQRLAPYKLPTRLLLLDDLPRNAMGKVTKAEVRRRIEDANPGASSEPARD